MTVQELIYQLQKLPSSADVFVDDVDNEQGFTLLRVVLDDGDVFIEVEKD